MSNTAVTTDSWCSYSDHSTVLYIYIPADKKKLQLILAHLLSLSFPWHLVLRSIQMLMIWRPKRWRSLPPPANSPALNLKGIAYGISVLLAQGRWEKIHVHPSSLQRDYVSSMPIWQRNLSWEKEDTAASKLRMQSPMPGKYPAEVFSLENAPTRMGNFPVQHPSYAQYHLRNEWLPPLQLTSPKHWYLHHTNLPIVNHQQG